MKYLDHLHCLGCGACHDPEVLMNLCPACQRPVQMALDIRRLEKDFPDTGWYQPGRRSMWRFGALLAGSRDPVTLGEGHTPQLDHDDHPLARQVGFHLRIKDEGHPHPGFGHNPTHSFKDRGMAMVATMARRFGLRQLVVPTQGNAGDSLAEYAIHAGLEAAVIMPADTPMPVLGKVAALARLHDNIHLDLVKGTIFEAGKKMKSDWLPAGFFNVATFQEPGWRIEGKKSLGLELAEPASPGDPWSLPDVILYPTGGGTGVLGMWKAFDELESLGLIDGRRPKMICVQAASTRPLVSAFEAGAEDTQPTPPGKTLATGLNVPGGVGHFRVLEIIRRSGGCALAVSEQDMAAALTRVWREKHWWIGPEGACCLAALEPLLDLGMIKRGQTVVAFNTGSSEKYLPNLRHLLG